MRVFLVSNLKIIESFTPGAKCEDLCNPCRRARALDSSSAKRASATHWTEEPKIF
jgi:hypothetical protein